MDILIFLIVFNLQFILHRLNQVIHQTAFTQMDRLHNQTSSIGLVVHLLNL